MAALSTTRTFSPHSPPRNRQRANTSTTPRHLTTTPGPASHSTRSKVKPLPRVHSPSASSSSSFMTANRTNTGHLTPSYSSISLTMPRLPRSSSSPTGISVTMSRSSSYRSKLYSPSVLPATNTMSYFPPFDSYGTEDDTTENDEIGERDEQDSRGEGVTPSPPADSTEVDRHSKTRSLTSLAGIISPLLSLAMLSPQKDGQVPTASPRPTIQHSTSDSIAVKALASKLAGKRSVLGPVSIEMNVGWEERVSARGGKRRMKSEFEVERVLGGLGEGLGLSLTLAPGLSSSSTRNTPRLDGGQLTMTRSRMSPTTNGQENEEERAVEDMVLQTRSPSRLQKLRPDLAVTGPTSAPVKKWRFPLPSPPITSLSADIPLQAFEPIANPCSGCQVGVERVFKSATAHSGELGVCGDHEVDDREMDEVDDTLALLHTPARRTSSGALTLASSSSSSSSSSTSGQLSIRTPSKVSMRYLNTRAPLPSSHHKTAGDSLPSPRPRIRGAAALARNASLDSLSPGSDDSDSDEAQTALLLMPKLERSVSQMSHASVDTIRASAVMVPSNPDTDGETTPKAGKGWKEVEADRVSVRMRLGGDTVVALQVDEDTWIE